MIKVLICLGAVVGGFAASAAGAAPGETDRVDGKLSIRKGGPPNFLFGELVAGRGVCEKRREITVYHQGGSQPLEELESTRTSGEGAWRADFPRQTRYPASEVWARADERRIGRVRCTAIKSRVLTLPFIPPLTQ